MVEKSCPSFLNNPPPPPQAFYPILHKYLDIFPQMMAAAMDDMQDMSMSPDTKVLQCEITTCLIFES